MSKPTPSLSSSVSSASPINAASLVAGDLPPSAKKAKTTKTTVFCFDGTGNDPSAATQDPELSDEIQQSSITNVLKLHLLLGGVLGDATSNYPSLKGQQQSFYYQGVGTLADRKLESLKQYAFATKDPETIVSDGLKDLETVSTDTDIVVIGFSRGAAIARQFCSKISSTPKLSGYRVALLLCFDTVASMGMPDFSVAKRPSSDVLFEDKNRSVAPCIHRAIHCVSLDDKRVAFQPTLMNKDPRVTEVWFAGAHSDVGGGYENDGLADVVLEFAKRQIVKYTALKLLTPKDIRYEDVHPVELDDMEIQAKAVDGVNHQQKTGFLPMFLRPTMYNRRLVVIDGDEIVDEHAPLVHPSVLERMEKRPSYRPMSLQNAKKFQVYSSTRNVLAGVE